MVRLRRAIGWCIPISLVLITVLLTIRLLDGDVNDHAVMLKKDRLFPVHPVDFDQLPDANEEQMLKMDVEDEEKVEALYVPQDKLVHLDLKGAPPKLTYYQLLFPLLRSLGATGLLIEYEDMFPYKGNLATVKAKNAYTENEIREILRIAADNKLSVIPLVQTFGHFEFVLKLENYKHLREDPALPQTVCASSEEGFSVIREMIGQVVDLHPGITHFHIGSDETYQIGTCAVCRGRMEKNDLKKADLFLSHVEVVASFVKQKYHIQPIMWDDMLRHLDLNMLEKYHLGSVVEPMIWAYKPELAGMFSLVMWHTFSQVFKNVWVASAFKGATGAHMYATNITHHLHNHLSWMKVLGDVHQAVGVRGIVVTGWQRYDHFSVLCELLPVGLPSLAVCLQVLRYGGEVARAVGEASYLMKCDWSIELSLPTDDSVRGIPGFPGGDIYHWALELYRFEQLWEHQKKSGYVRGYMSDVNVRYNFTNVFIVSKSRDILAHEFLPHLPTVTNRKNT